MVDRGHAFEPTSLHRPVSFRVDPLQRFMLIKAGDGGILLIAALIALLLANSPLGSTYNAFWQKESGLALGDPVVRMPLQLWINDALMPVFFFAVGLEVKREFVTGEL